MPTRPIVRPRHLPSRTALETGLRSRYAVTESDVDLVDGPDGARGSFSFYGNFTLPTEGGAAHDARALIQAFIAREADLLGLGRPDDLVEASLETVEPSGSTIAVYRRYVGDLALEDAGFVAVIDRAGKLVAVTGHLVPLPAGLFEAAGRRTLAQTDVRRIIAADELKDGHDPNRPTTFGTLAVPAPPYVVWTARTEWWMYRVDAFTGAIVDKLSGRVSAR